MPIKPTTLLTILALSIAILLLSACSSLGQPAQAFANSTPFTPDTPIPVTPSPIPPTPTAVIFQLKPTSTPLPTEPPPQVDAPVFYGPDTFPVGVNPLTGLEVADPTLLERRPMAIKVTNFPRSVRDQWGLTLADHVYEYYLENSITRFIGIFYGNDASRVGPVRSGRFFDEHLVRMYKSIFVFASADERVLKPWLESDLLNFLIIERGDNCPPLCRIGEKTNYNTLFANTSDLTQYINERGTNNDPQDLHGLRFESMLPYSDQYGITAAFRYSFVDYNLWRYDPLTRRYLRFQEDQDENQGSVSYRPLKDSLTGEQLSADNLIVLLIPHEYYVNTKTTEMIKIHFLGQGDGYALREGQIYPIRWSRTEETQMVSLRFKDGRPYPLKPGNVWFQVLGETSEVTQTGGEWHFDFHIP